MLERRNAIVGLSSLLALPSIARAGLLMRVSPIIPSDRIKWAGYQSSAGELTSCTVCYEGNHVETYRSTVALRRLARQIGDQVGFSCKGLPQHMPAIGIRSFVLELAPGEITMKSRDWQELYGASIMGITFKDGRRPFTPFLT